MTDTMLASAVALPDEESDTATQPSGMKRRLSESPEGVEGNEQESKRQRISPGKNSPNAARDDDASSNPPATDADLQDKREDPREARRKSGVADEKQRSKRLFGALLGSLNQPRDRTSKRRQEIESRRKAELQRQDDERLEDKQRRQERLAEQRKKAQAKVEEDNMHIRHSNMLNRAHYLQTLSEPRIFYKPWDLRPDEEDRIDDQVRDVQAQIDQELDDFDERQRVDNDSRDAVESPKAAYSNGAITSPTSVSVKVVDGHTSDDVINEGDQVAVKSTNETAKPAEVPESPTDTSTNPTSSHLEAKTTPNPQESKMEDMEDDGEHLEGAEDSVIY